MTHTVQDYLTRFASSARGAGVPGRRIGEAVAEIEAHLAEAGESPEVVFGDPVAYARRLAREQPPARPPYRLALAGFYGILLGGFGVVVGAWQATGHAGVRLGPLFLVPLALSVAAALMWAPVHRRDPRGIGSFWVLAALTAAATGIAVATPWRQVGVIAPAWVLLAAGALALLGGGAALFAQLPRTEAIIDPQGRDRSELGRRAVDGRILLAGTMAALATLTVVIVVTGGR